MIKGVECGNLLSESVKIVAKECPAAKTRLGPCQIEHDIPIGGYSGKRIFNIKALIAGFLGVIRISAKESGEWKYDDFARRQLIKDLSAAHSYHLDVWVAAEYMGRICPAQIRATT